MRQNEYKALTDKVKMAANGKEFTHFSHASCYRLQENKSDKAQALSITFISNNVINVNFYNLYNLEQNKFGFMAYKDSKNVTSDYYSLTHKQVTNLCRLLMELQILSNNF